MATSINGKPAPWTAEIEKLFKERVPPLNPGDVLTSANYHTPRPYQDEYSTGSREMGFVYTLNARTVCAVQWIP